MPEEPFSISLKALPVSQKIGEFYVASMEAQDLVKISYSDVRRLVSEQRDLERYLGIQRPVSKKRVREIRQYLRGRDATFPTSVIVAVDGRCAEFDKDTGILTLRSFTPEAGSGEDEIPAETIARVIDGQHRIAAFLDDGNQWLLPEMEELSDFEFNLSIFIGADIPEQANIFATVNLAQTKVNRSLVYDLTGLAKTKSPHKTCHNVAVMLDREPRSPFYERIKRLGVATPGRKREPLTQASFVEALLPFIASDPVSDRNLLLDGRSPRSPNQVELQKHPFRNLFLGGEESDIGVILFNYFSAVRKKWPHSWDELGNSSNLLPKTNAFKALMKFLREDVYLEIVGSEIGKIPEVTDFSPFFEPLNIRDEDFTTRNFVPGSGGQTTFLKMLRQEVGREDLIDHE